LVALVALVTFCPLRSRCAGGSGSAGRASGAGITLIALVTLRTLTASRALLALRAGRPLNARELTEVAPLVKRGVVPDDMQRHIASNAGRRILVRSIVAVRIDDVDVIDRRRFNVGNLRFIKVAVTVRQEASTLRACR